jgi:hypothetical protein
MDFRVFVLASAFGLIETAYFGWNMTPQSEAELICDGITLVLFALAFLRGRG